MAWQSNNPATVRECVILEPELAKTLKQVAAQRGRSVQELVEEGLIYILKREAVRTEKRLRRAVQNAAH